jgi:hypothetical protein
MENPLGAFVSVTSAVVSMLSAVRCASLRTRENAIENNRHARADQLFAVRARSALEPAVDAVGGVAEDATARGDGARPVFETAVPNGGTCSLHRLSPIQILGKGVASEAPY